MRQLAKPRKEKEQIYKQPARENVEEREQRLALPGNANRSPASGHLLFFACIRNC